MLEVGKASDGDLLQIKSQLATDNLAFVNAENQLDLYRVILMQLMPVSYTHLTLPTNREV